MGARAQFHQDGISARRIAILDVMGVSLMADLSGALFWEEQSLLVVSDLHLEKGSSFARRGVLLPPYDSAATLALLALAIARHNLPIQLNRHTVGLHSQLLHERSQRQCVFRLPLLAIDHDSHGPHDTSSQAWKKGRRRSYRPYRRK